LINNRLEDIYYKNKTIPVNSYSNNLSTSLSNLYIILPYSKFAIYLFGMAEEIKNPLIDNTNMESESPDGRSSGLFVSSRLRPRTRSSRHSSFPILPSGSEGNVGIEGAILGLKDILQDHIYESFENDIVSGPGPGPEPEPDNDNYPYYEPKPDNDNYPYYEPEPEPEPEPDNDNYPHYESNTLRKNQSDFSRTNYQTFISEKLPRTPKGKGTMAPYYKLGFKLGLEVARKLHRSYIEDIETSQYPREYLGPKNLIRGYRMTPYEIAFEAKARARAFDWSQSNEEIESADKITDRIRLSIYRFRHKNPQDITMFENNFYGLHLRLSEKLLSTDMSHYTIHDDYFKENTKRNFGDISGKFYTYCI
jgi:hypothetical protein